MQTNSQKTKADSRLRARILFIQGGGQGAYAEDEKLAANLQNSLGPGYEVHYPKMPNEDDPTYESWKGRLGKELAALEMGSMIVAHSVGGPNLLRYLAEKKVPKPITALFFVAAPYFGRGGWSADGWDIGTLLQQKNFVSQVTETVPVFFYHNRDDSVVPFSHLGLYKDLLPRATIRAFDRGGHQFNKGLNALVRDIKGL
ncbi:MAG TPA: alpha/beta hydrolase [Pyrinomonadaceae bacterium]|nr:alpha/beta hydrolase [Pyrinomonadaceae bacterium]